MPIEKIGDLSVLALMTKPKSYAGGPMFDAATVVDPSPETFRRAEAAKIPIIIGTTSQDLPAIFPPVSGAFNWFLASRNR